MRILATNARLAHATGGCENANAVCADPVMLELELGQGLGPALAFELLPPKDVGGCVTSATALAALSLVVLA
jgi:hypothetical protein